MSASPASHSLQSVLVSLEGDDRITFQERLTVGRAPGNDLVLRHPRISTHHAVLERTTKGWRIADLGSRNGTSVDGKRVRSTRSLRVGHELRFGGISGWRVEALCEPGSQDDAVAFVDNLASHRRVPVRSDRFLIGTGAPCDLVVPEWQEQSSSPIRVVIYEETGQQWLSPADDVPGMALGDEPWGGDAVPLDEPLELQLGATRLAVVPQQGGVGIHTTERLHHRPKRYDLDLHLTFDGPAEGAIRVVTPDGEWSIHTGQRFVLLYLLADAGGEWVKDDDLRVKLWGRAGLYEIDKGALHKLIHDTRQMFLKNGTDGWFLEKSSGRTRLRLAPDRIHVKT